MRPCKAVLAAFEQQVKARFEAEAPSAGGRGAEHERRRWGEVLRVIYLQQRNLAAYLALCEATELTPQDCLAVATLLKARRKPDEALTWVERGIELDKKRPDGTMVCLDLAKLRRELLTKASWSPPRSASRRAIPTWPRSCTEPSACAS